MFNTFQTVQSCVSSRTWYTKTITKYMQPPKTSACFMIHSPISNLLSFLASFSCLHLQLKPFNSQESPSTCFALLLLIKPFGIVSTSTTQKQVTEGIDDRRVYQTSESNIHQPQSSTTLSIFLHGQLKWYHKDAAKTTSWITFARSHSWCVQEHRSQVKTPALNQLTHGSWSYSALERPRGYHPIVKHWFILVFSLCSG